MKTKIAVATAVLSLAVAPAALAAPSSGKTGAPGQVCKVKGKKTADQRAERKLCIKAAVAARKAERAGGGTTPEDPYTDPYTGA